MIWLLPLLCSGLICWANRGAIATAMLPPPAFQAPRQLQFQTRMPLLPPVPAYYALPQHVMMPRGTGQMAALPEGAFVASPFSQRSELPARHAGGPSAPHADRASASPAQPQHAVAFSSTPRPPAPIALLRAATDGCPIRPEPMVWDDATLGRMPGSFTTPANYPIGVLSYGPVGWANVLVNHPDEGPVEGWVETRHLKANEPPSSSPAQASTPVQPTAKVTGTGNGAPTSASSARAARKAAMAQHAMYMRSKPPTRQVRAAAARPR